jgi:signal transduction histidine kinase
MKTKSLRMKLTLFFVLVAVIPVLLIGMHQMYLFSTVEEQKVHSRRLEIAETTATLIDQYLRDASRTLEFTARLPQVRNLSSAAEYDEALGGIPTTVDLPKWRTLELLRLTYSPFLYTFIVLDDGTTLLISPHTYQEFGLKNTAFTDWYKRAITSGQTIYSDTFSLVTAGPEVNVVTPIWTDEGRIQGLLGASLDLERVANVLEGVDVGEGGSIFLVDRFGVTIESRRETLIQFPFVKRVLRGEEGTLIGRWRGEEHLIAYHPIPRTGWGILVLQPTRYAFASAIATRNTIFLVTVGGALLAILVGFFLARGVAGPIIRLREAVVAIGEGRARTVPVESQDEIGELAVSFNEMTHRLETLHRELMEKSQEFMKERDRLHTVLANMGDGLAMVDEDSRIQLLNWFFYQRFGPESIGKESHEVILGRKHGADFPCPVKELIKEVRSGIREKELEARRRKRLSADPRFIETAQVTRAVEMTSTDGRTYLITLSTARDPDGSYYTIEVYKDITERKRMEDQVRKHARELAERNRELAEKGKEIENFVYTISHDLKSPLSTLQGFTSLLEDEYGDVLGKEGGFYIERIRKNVERMGNLITDLLELSRIGRITQPFQEVDTGEVVREIVQQMTPAAREKGIRFRISEDLPVVWGEENRIMQLFTNLIDNAVKYMGEVEEPFVEVGATEREKDFLFYVRDNGIGIPKEYHEKIFRIFQRIEDRRMKDVEGTGMGLTICQKIVAHHKGKIWVESEPEKGSTFFFTLPKRPKRP